MKTYYYSETEKKAKFGRSIEQKIYKLEKGIPKLLAVHEFNTGSCMGSISEAFQGLVNAGVLSNKYKGKYSIDIPYAMWKL